MKVLIRMIESVVTECSDGAQGMSIRGSFLMTCVMEREKCTGQMAVIIRGCGRKDSSTVGVQQVDIVGVICFKGMPERRGLFENNGLVLE